MLVLLQILLEYTIKKIKAPIGDENLLPTVVSSFLHSIKKIKAPIGDENTYYEAMILPVLSIKKIKAPIGDENGLHHVIVNRSGIKLRK